MPKPHYTSFFKYRKAELEQKVVQVAPRADQWLVLVVVKTVLPSKEEERLQHGPDICIPPILLKMLVAFSLQGLGLWLFHRRLV